MQGRKITQKQKYTFLATLSHSGNVTLSAEAVGVSRVAFYDIRANDVEFASAWDNAVAEACDRLEAEAWRRAYAGVDEPVVSMGKVVMVDGEVVDPETGEKRAARVPMVIRKYSDTLMVQLLKAHKPDKYRENIKQQVDGKQTVEFTFTQDSGPAPLAAPWAEKSSTGSE